MSDCLSSSFCKLTSELTISYNGLFLEHSKKHRDLSGYILSRDGVVSNRKSIHSEWSVVTTPEVFLFYDNDSYITYLVNRCDKVIEQIFPHGRILDCTDRVIYEIKDDAWCPVCDLSEKDFKLVIRCTYLKSSEGLSKKEVVLTPSIKYVKGKFVTETETCFIRFDVVGNDAVVDSELSEINKCDVDLCSGSINGNIIEYGQCKVLVYRTVLCNEKTLVFHLFQRSTEKLAFSAKCGQFLPIVNPENDFPGVALPENDSCCSEQDGVNCVMEPTAGSSPDSLSVNLVPIVDWGCVIGKGFDIGTGCWKVPVTGLYRVSAVVSLCTTQSVLNLPTTSLLLVHYSSGFNSQINGGKIVAQAPFNLNASTSQAVINVLTNAEPCDVLCLYYVDRLEPNSTLLNNTYLIRNSTTFNAELL